MQYVFQSFDDRARGIVRVRTHRAQDDSWRRAAAMFVWRNPFVEFARDARDRSQLTTVVVPRNMAQLGDAL
jgi:hypothetical protein